MGNTNDCCWGCGEYYHDSNRCRTKVGKIPKDINHIVDGNWKGSKPGKAKKFCSTCAGIINKWKTYQKAPGVILDWAEENSHLLDSRRRRRRVLERLLAAERAMSC